MRKVAVVGAGVMGHSIAQVFSMGNLEVSLIDTDMGILGQAIRNVKHNLLFLAKYGNISEDRVESILGRITGCTDLAEGLNDSDLVLESIPEVLRKKLALFKKMDDLSSSRTILASNSATIPIRKIASATANKSRVIGMHWVNPPYLVPVVEVIPSEFTSPEVTRRTSDLLRSLDKIPIICKDIPGKLLLRVQMAALNEAIRLLEQNVASAEEIDEAVKYSMGLRLPLFGLLGMNDRVANLRTTHYALQFLYRSTGEKQFKPTKLMRRMLEKGETGVWAHKGFHDYEGSPAKILEERDRLILRLASFLRDLEQATKS